MLTITLSRALLLTLCIVLFIQVLYLPSNSHLDSRFILLQVYNCVWSDGMREREREDNANNFSSLSLMSGRIPSLKDETGAVSSQHLHAKYSCDP